MINERDIELIEKYLFGKLSEEEKYAFDKRIETDKEFVNELDFMRDLKISSSELGKTELRNKLKAVAINYKSNENNKNSSLKTYLAIAASIAILVGIATLLYFLNIKDKKNTDNIAGLNDSINTIEVKQIIESLATNTKLVNINSVDGNFGYAQTDSLVTYKFPVLIIPSEKYANSYLYRDTLFLFLASAETPHFYSLSEQSIFLYLSLEKESLYYVELKKDTKLTSIKKVDDIEVINRIKTFLEKK